MLTGPVQQDQGCVAASCHLCGAEFEKATSVPLNQEAELRRSSSKNNMMRFRPPPLQQPGVSFSGRGAHGRGVMSPLGKSAEGIVSPLGKSAEGIVSPFARAQVHIQAGFCMLCPLH